MDRESARTAVGLVLASVLLGACADPGAGSLTVDLRTDLSPGIEFVAVRIDVSSTPFGAGEPAAGALTDHAPVFSGMDFVTGRRIASFEETSTGPAFVRVSLLDPRGDTVVDRITTVTLRGRVSMVVVVTRACRGVVCPAEGGSRDATSCARGHCVPPTCTAETPEFCGEPECTTTADCSSAIACVSSLCAEGACFEVGDHTRCAEGEWCNPAVGCMLRGGVCAPSETSCTDSGDDDCDDLIDCADPDCGGRACDDGSACTESDVCGGDGGVCTGVAITCDDGNGCTDDACDATTGECAYQPNTASCDDGLFCNGADTCAGGGCTAHAGTPCPELCSESTRACTACESAADCGSAPPIAWAACAFANPCSTSGTQSGTVTTLSCNAGMCDTAVSSTTRACSRPTRQGMSCGSTRDRCCGGSCVDTWSDERNCGGCGLSCVNGRSCTIVRQGGGAACFECYENADCSFGSVADGQCWPISSGGGAAGYCRCYRREACAPGQQCRVGTAVEDNYCYYP